jgi:hypothetical protein
LFVEFLRFIFEPKYKTSAYEKDIVCHFYHHPVWFAGNGCSNSQTLANPFV